MNMKDKIFFMKKKNRFGDHFNLKVAYDEFMCNWRITVEYVDSNDNVYYGMNLNGVKELSLTYLDFRFIKANESVAFDISTGHNSKRGIGTMLFSAMIEILVEFIKEKGVNINYISGKLTIADKDKWENSLKFYEKLPEFLEFNVSQKFILSGDNFIQTLNAPSVTKEDFIKAGKNGKIIFVVQELINN